MKKKQIQQFNEMRRVLRVIAFDYLSPEQIHRQSDIGVSKEEEVEMAYENIQCLAKAAVKGIREIKLQP